MSALAAAVRARPLPALMPATVLLGGAWLLTFAGGPWADESVNDLFVYRSYADLFLDGLLPFRDVAFEYPPLGALPLWLAGLAGTGAETYRVAFALLMLATALAVLPLCGRLASLTGGSRARALLAFAALPLLAGAMVRTHFDLLPVALALGALVAIAAGRVEAGFALAGVGALTKAFPLLVALLALAWLLGRGDRRAALRGTAALAATAGVLAGAWVALSPEGAWDAIAYHVERPVQVESVPAAILYAGDGLGLFDAPAAVFSHRSDGLSHPAAGELAALATLALVALLAWVAAAVWRRPGARALVLAVLAAIAASATLGKVLSPQFLVWIAPLGALAAAWRMWPLAAAVAAATLLTLAEFPSRYFDVVDQEPFALALVGLRNAAMLVVVALAVRALQREPREWA